ncbi:MAG: carboxypeptidase regulatory-like domain-containing protein [bacterium]
MNTRDRRPLGVHVRRAWCAAAMLMLMLLSSQAGAQSIDILLREESTKAPLAGAIVNLLRDSSIVAQGLTNAAGRVIVRAPEAGTFRLKIIRIGFRPMLTDRFTITGTQSVKQVLDMSTARIVLPAMDVKGESKCTDRADDGALAATLWEQVRSALTASVLTQSQWKLPLRVQEFRRDVDFDGNVTRDRVVSSRVVHGPPFAAFPPESLSKRGFVYESDHDVFTFAAPDAALLVSDEFVSGHCFRAIGGTADSVGLAFEPPARKKSSDVRGTLWLDRATTELRSMSFAYTGLGSTIERSEAGGRLEFKRLPSGAWIVSYWHIRMPRMQPAEFSSGMTQKKAASVTGYLDEGGRVNAESTAPAAGSAADVVARAELTGHVFDSTTMAPLAGAIARLRGQSDSAITDKDGRFELASVNVGTQTVDISHVKLGLLSDRTSREVVLSLSEGKEVAFAVPPPDAFVKELCGPAAKGAGLVGQTFTAAGAPVEDVDVRVTYVGAKAAKQEERTRSGPRGLYVICALPAGQQLPVRLQRGTAKLAEQVVTLTKGEYRWLDLKAAAP